MVKLNGVKISKGRKRKLAGKRCEIIVRDLYYQRAVLRAYRWREL